MNIVFPLISFVATFYFVYWMGGALIFSSLPDIVTLLVSLATATGVAFYVWRHSTKTSPSLISSIAMGALMTGAIGFVAGFFGPMVFTPGANQGPLLGLFITGPLGFLLGAVGGAIYWFARGRRVVPQIR